MIRINLKKPKFILVPYSRGAWIMNALLFIEGKTKDIHIPVIKEDT